MDITTIKGFKDILPQEVGTWQILEAKARDIFRSFGFKEIKTPIMEKTELFSRGIGQDTDIVSKEMYTLEDSKGRGLTLRPEATASVVRAYIQHRLYQHNPVQKLFSIGPMFRHERPQKGRFRQFHQVNAEVFGDQGPKSDADLISMAMYLFEVMGLSDVSLNINSLGCPECRVIFRKELKKYLDDGVKGLCSDCERRSETNPLRVFDCKVESCKELVFNAPSILDFICEDCRDHFNSLQDYLSSFGIKFIVNNTLVRGLDYYNRTTFEIQTDRLGSQNAVAGGGRYDGLVKQLGGPDHPGLGFAIGIERLVALIDEANEKSEDCPDLYIIGLGDASEKKAFSWCNEFRRAGFWVEMEYISKSLKAQMKKADRFGGRWTLIVGEDELEKGIGILRNMKTKEQKEIALDNLVANISEILAADTH
ncbi:histidine--tRNA ligase [Thermodesulfobacteriota bacterium]